MELDILNAQSPDNELGEDAIEHKPDDVKEQIIEAIGGFGKWQLRKCMFIIFVIWTPASFHLLNMVFFRYSKLPIRIEL